MGASGFGLKSITSSELVSATRIDLSSTNASRIPCGCGVAARARRSPGQKRMCVDNNLEAAITWVHGRLRREPIRDGVEEKKTRRGRCNRAACSSNYRLIPRAGLKVDGLIADGIKGRHHTRVRFECSLHDD